MKNYFNKVEMTAIGDVAKINHEYNEGDRVILEYDDGDILINNGIATENDLYIDDEIEEQIEQLEEYYKSFNVPLEAIITRIEPYEKHFTGGFYSYIRLYLMVYFPSHKDGHLLLWKCDSCGTENEAIYCRQCGKRRTLPIDYWICPKCNKQINIEDNFCGMCGSANPNREKINNHSSQNFQTKEIINATTKKQNQELKVDYTPNLHTIANSITKGRNSNTCTELFKQAIELKRNGSFVLAIEKEKHAIKIYPDSPDLSQMFMGLGKLFYLAGKLDKCKDVYALSIYRTFNNPSNIINGNPSPAYNLSAIHYGHAIMDKNINNDAINFYKKSIMGKQMVMSTISDYDNMCIATGMKYVYELYEKYRNGLAEDDYKKLYYRTIEP